MELKKIKMNRDMNVVSWNNSIRHGHISSPASRAKFAEQAGLIQGNLHNGIECGKFFPATMGGLADPDAPQDVMNTSPPLDGKIASGGQVGASYLDKTDIDWPKHKVYGGEAMDFIWYFSARHKYRRFNYFITRKDWDPSRPLSRDQFEPKPFETHLNQRQPYWAFSDAEMLPANPTTHTIKLPEREGYHVLLGVWEIAETDKAFYQVIDLEFLSIGDGNQRPSAPNNVIFDNVTFNSVELKWGVSEGNNRINKYSVVRNGVLLVAVDATQTRYVDDTVLPLTQYTYTVTAIDDQGNESAPSVPVTITTPSEGETDTQPSAPTGLHSMGTTSNSVRLMWVTSISATSLRSYVIYRNGYEVSRISCTLREFTDTGLTPNTAYRYFVTALDTNEQESVPSNVLSVSTDEVNTGSGNYPIWRLNDTYKTGDIVSNVGKFWRCLATHTAYDPSWAPGASDGFTLWSEFKPTH